MHSADDAIVRPLKGPRSPNLGPLALLVATALDLKDIRSRLALSREHSRHLFVSRLWQQSRATVVGPIVGAPYAAMILETLVAWGARKFLFLGWCGSLVAELKIGEILLPGSAIIDEGTSGHYRSDAKPIASAPCGALRADIEYRFAERQGPLRFGRVWSTDAVFRETPQKVQRFTEMGAEAVDMETSALFSVADFHQVELAALLVVSDTLAGMRWEHGFRTEAFLWGRNAALDAVAAMIACEEPNGG